MFWGLTIEPGKHYSQTVDQSFHVSMAALDTREKSGITQLLVRHEKAEFLLCTLQYGDDQPCPVFQQQLNLNLAEGSEISFYSEGKGTIHLTGYLVVDEPITMDPDLLGEAERLLEEEEEDEELYDSDEDEEDDEDDDEDMESDASATVNWAKMIQDAGEEDEEESEEDEWTPESAKKAKTKAKDKKRKVAEDAAPDTVASGKKKKRKAAVQAETLSKNEMDEEEEDEEEDDQDFMPADESEEEEEEEADGDFDEDEDSDGDDYEDEEEEDEVEESDEKQKPAIKKKADKKSADVSPKKIKKELASKEVPVASSELSAKKKKKKKKQQQATGEEGEEGSMPLKNLGADNKENIAAQKKETPAKKEKEQAKKPATHKKVKLRSGTTVEELKVGEGRLAKPGKKVFMYYRGVLANNQKEFDSCLSGKPFMFILGRAEVIKGWDDGITGMKVGGKRRLTVPPSQGYGSSRVGPIPPNSTLVFDVELKQVR